MTQSPKLLIIVGGGGFAREVIWLAQSISDQWSLQGILDDSTDLQGKILCGAPVLGTLSDWKRFPEAWYVIAVGSPRIRKEIVEKMCEQGCPRFATLVHASVLHSQEVKFGEGCIVAAGCILTTQVTIGNHCILNLAVTVGHDVAMGDFCTVAPQCAISGNISLGAGVEIGTGSALIQGISLLAGSMLGAGSIATKNIEENCLAVGVPARSIKKLSQF